MATPQIPLPRHALDHVEEMDLENKKADNLMERAFSDGRLSLDEVPLIILAWTHVKQARVISVHLNKSIEP